MRVVTSCFSRFHIFDQASQLHRLGVLENILTACPKRWAKDWDIPQQKVVSLPLSGAYGYVVEKGLKKVHPLLGRLASESLHSHFSKRLARYIPSTCDVFIGLSSLCLEAIIEAKKKGIFTVVDHGSVHQRAEKKILLEECKLLSISIDEVVPSEWIIEKEEDEFEVADCVSVLSDVARRTLVEAGIPREKVMVNNCGVCLSDFKPYPKSDNIFRIIQCSAITPTKGVHYLLQAFSELKLPDSELWIVGRGKEVSPLLPKIKQYAASNVYFKGAYPQAELSGIYSQGSIFVLPSLVDGFGMVVPQAMACGLPVIVTENVGAADLVMEGKNGFIIPIRDVDALKDRILRLYENKDLLLDMSRNALRSVSDGYTWNDYGDRLLAELKERVCC
ncbi:glycosyltransferase family 4 protein [Candidatus Nitrospira salsa]|nr:MAG: hypothetical protein NPIRA01_04680 [Nitrospirales bacterium]